jgi:hypothetical protein
MKGRYENRLPVSLAPMGPHLIAPKKPIKRGRRLQWLVASKQALWKITRQMLVKWFGLVISVLKGPNQCGHLEKQPQSKKFRSPTACEGIDD